MSIEEGSQVPGGHIRLLLHFELGVEILQAGLRKAFEIDATVLPRFADELHEELKILLPLAGAEIDAKARRIEARAQNARAIHGLFSGGDRESNVVATGSIARGVVDILRKVEILDFRGNLGRKVRGVEVRNAADTAAPFAKDLPHRLNVVANGRDGPDTGYNNSPPHTALPVVPRKI